MRYARHAARDVEGLELAAVCRRDAATGQRIAADCGCDYVADPRSLIERPDVDAIVFVTLPTLLEPLVELAAAHRKRIVIEKPVAPDFATGQRILGWIERNEAYCLAAQTLRFNTVVRELRGRLPTLGRLDSIVLTQRFPPQLELDWMDDRSRSGGGNILHTGVHCFDLIRYVTGYTPAWVACAASGAYTRRTEDNFVALLGFRERKTLAMVNCSRSTHSRSALVELSGDSGMLRGDHVLHTLAHVTSEGVSPIALPEPAHTVLEVLRCLVENAANDSQPTIPYLDGLAAVAMADACYRSIASGAKEPVVLPGVEP
jgi:predicted dehydrogenase